MGTTKAYPSKIVMLQDLDELVEGLDLNASAFLPRFSFVTSDGETYLCPIAMTFVQNFNKVFGEILDINGCRTTGGGRGKCILTFLDKDIEDAPKEDPKEVIIEEEIIEDEASLEEDTAPKLDLDYAMSLIEGNSKKEAKEALELYGRTLNVELNRQLSFSNMIKELTEAVAAK